MYGLTELKAKRKNRHETVICPVKGCHSIVPRMRKNGLNLANKFDELTDYLCSDHRILISPSTFAHESEFDNLIWNSDVDKSLLHEIFSAKKESRMGFEKSEDAITWNVFRYLQKQHFLPKNYFFESYLDYVKPEKLENITNNNHDYDVIYWSYSVKEKQTWALLKEARAEFGEKAGRFSEPDIIINTEDTLYFIEAKVCADNNTTPSDPKNRKKYDTGGDVWFNKVFNSDFETIAVQNRKYQLMRFWLIGTWIADKIGKKFSLVSLVRKGEEESLVSDFGKLIIQTDDDKFVRTTWETVYDFIKLKNMKDSNTMRILDFFRNKTLGYDRDGNLNKCFNIEEVKEF